MDYFQILSSGLYSDDPAQTLEEELEYFVSHGLFAGFGEAIVTDIFEVGQYLIRQPFSEDYLLGGVDLIIRLPWTENYETPAGEQFIRDSFSEDYNNETYRRVDDTEDYETDTLYFRRLPFSENYLIQ